VTDPSSTHRPSPPLGSVLKLTASLGVVLAGCSVSWETWPLAGSLIATTAAGLAIAGVRIRTLVRRLFLFLPFVFLIAISIPISQGFSAPWLQVAATVVLRGVISFLSGLWLIQVLPFDQLLTTLRGLYLPSVVVASLAMMHRYLFVLWEETGRLRIARRARTLGHSNRIAKWMTGVALVGTLVVRSLDRAHRIHRAMLSRGWDGHVRPWP